MFYWKTGTDKRKYKARLEKICRMVLIVHLFEVGIESSLNALLQWYTILPEILSKLWKVVNHEEKIEEFWVLSIVSFTFSILSLSWSLVLRSVKWNLVRKGELLQFQNPYAYTRGPERDRKQVHWYNIDVYTSIYIHLFFLLSSCKWNTG